MICKQKDKRRYLLRASCDRTYISVSEVASNESFRPPGKEHVWHRFWFSHENTFEIIADDHSLAWTWLCSYCSRHCCCSQCWCLRCYCCCYYCYCCCCCYLSWCCWQRWQPGRWSPLQSWGRWARWKIVKIVKQWVDESKLNNWPTLFHSCLDILISFSSSFSPVVYHIWCTWIWKKVLLKSFSKYKIPKRIPTFVLWSRFSSSCFLSLCSSGLLRHHHTLLQSDCSSSLFLSASLPF